MNILRERKGDAALLTLNWPERANALSPAMATALSAAVDETIESGARALLLTGAGKTFCSGGQLDDPLPDDAGEILETTLNPLMRKLKTLEIPLIVALNGPAVGAGASLALAGDIVIAARTAWLGFSFAQVGLVCDSGASWLLPRALGWQRAMAAMLLGKRITSQDALDWGLVTELVEDEQLMEKAEAMAERLAAGPTQAFGIIRTLAHKALETDFASALTAERAGQYIAGRSQDFQEGVAAFRERRSPRFQGR